MGVTHKLKEEVVAFIIDQKKNDPALSVRKLSELTSKTFEIKVSKSSVSTVLKNASLSSAVGRRSSGAPKPGKFKLPDRRKDELSERMGKAGFSKPDAEQPAAEKETPARPAWAPAPVKQPPGVVPEETVVRDREDAGFLRQVDLIRAEKEKRKSPVSTGMGCIFLKAAQWELMGSVPLSEWFEQHVTAGDDREVFEAACDLFVFFRALGAATPDEADGFRDHALARLHGRGNVTDWDQWHAKLNELYRFESSMDETVALNMGLAYGLDKEQMFREVRLFRLLAEDDSALDCDAQLHGFAKGGPEPDGGTWPVNKAMAWLSRYLISNVRAPVFRLDRRHNELGQAFFDMVSIFENAPRKAIVKAAALNGRKNALVEFSVIPKQKRKWLLGIHPEIKEFRQLNEAAKWGAKRPFYHHATDRIVYYAPFRSGALSGRFQGGMEDINVITVWQARDKDPAFAILAHPGPIDSEAAVESFLSRWPNINREEAAGPGGQGSAPPTEQPDRFRRFGDVPADFLNTLHGYCQRRFFPPELSNTDVTKMIRSIYGISGTVTEYDGAMTVALEGQGSAHLKALEQAVSRVNESHIYAPNGLKLWVRL